MRGLALEQIRSTEALTNLFVTAPLMPRIFSTLLTNQYRPSNATNLEGPLGARSSSSVLLFLATMKRFASLKASVRERPYLQKPPGLAVSARFQIQVARLLRSRWIRQRRVTWGFIIYPMEDWYQILGATSVFIPFRVSRS